MAVDKFIIYKFLILKTEMIDEDRNDMEERLSLSLSFSLSLYVCVCLTTCGDHHQSTFSQAKLYWLVSSNYLVFKTKMKLQILCL